MKNWTIKKRIVAGFAVLVVLSTLMGILAWYSLRSISGHTDEVSSDNIPGLSVSANVLQNLNRAHLLLIQHVLTTNLEEKRAYETGIQEIAATNTQLLAQLEKYCDAPEEQQLSGKLKQARADYVNARSVILKLSDEGKKEEALAQMTGAIQTAYATYDKLSMAFNDFETDLTTDAIHTIQHTASSSKFTLGLVAVAELAIGVLLSLVIVIGLNRVLQYISSSLNESAIQVNDAAGQVASASQSLAQGSAKQAASIEETSASIEELSGMTKSNDENVQKAKELAKQARTAAERGSADMQAMSAAMDAIKTSSDDIAKIIKTIDEIAFQTNILALNAAVEAARAGEAGMGFAVVADEVRNLAQRSAQAAKETAGKIEAAINRTAQGVEISSKVAATLAEIVTQARQVDELATEVAGASREQSQGITQINAAIGQMDAVTQNNAANAEESAAAAEQLNAQAETMKGSVQDLLHLVGGKKSTVAPVAARTDNRAAKQPLVAARPAKMAPQKAVERSPRHAQPAADSPVIPMDPPNTWIHDQLPLEKPF